jgi:hypothetical protein
MSSQASGNPASLKAKCLTILKLYAAKRCALLAREAKLAETLVSLTHEEPVLGARGLRANIKMEESLRDQHADALAQSPSDDAFLSAIESAIDDVSNWVDTTKELREVRAEIKFFEKQGVILADMYVHCVQYEKKKEAVEADGGVIVTDFEMRSSKVPNSGLKTPEVWRKERAEKKKKK